MNRLINELAGELRSIIAEVNGKYDTAEASHETALRIEDEIRKRINDRIQDVITANALDITPKKMFILVCRRLQGIPFDENLTELTRRGIRFTCIEKAASIKSAWTRMFTRNIPADALNDIYYHQYRWHIYSYKKADCLSGDEARKAFDEAEKSELYLFFQDAAYGYKIENAKLLTAADLDWCNDGEHSDAYIFDPQSGWTYVKTHEADRYFARV